MSLPQNHNEVDSALNAAQQPVHSNVGLNPLILLPKTGGYELVDGEKYLQAPTRKRGRIVLDDAESFCRYLNKHGDGDRTVIYCEANYAAGTFQMTGILNDHGKTDPAWRDHVCAFVPKQTEEWKRWFSNNGKQLTQIEFAEFIEENMRDISSMQVSEDADDVTPSGSQMLEMALNLEAVHDVRFKSAVRLTDGGVGLTFVNQADEGTAKQMKLFERFSLGIAPFFNGDAYRMDARLRYRVNTQEGTLKFWYELVRPDKVLQDAAQHEVLRIEEDCPDFIVLFGSPNIKS
jgi:uncharacterized protein YfdQ (DUF2303 family)